jgi:hypothetical protein
MAGVVSKPNLLRSAIPSILKPATVTPPTTDRQGTLKKLERARVSTVTE